MDYSNIRVSNVTRDRIGRYTSYAHSTWDLRLQRILDLLEGKAFEGPKSEEELERVEIPLHTLPPEIVQVLTRLKRQAKTTLRKNGKKKK